MHRPTLILSASLLSLLFVGCGFGTIATQTAVQGPALSGHVHGGRQPIAGAAVYLFAAGTSGYDQSSVDLISASSGTVSNPVYVDTLQRPYVTTNGNGVFLLTNTYSCTPGTQVYVYTSGGNPGLPAGQTNDDATLMAVVGQCPAAGTFPSSLDIQVNEVTTVAAAYALAGFATSPTAVSSSSTTQGVAGIATAFANAGVLASIQTGGANSATPTSGRTTAGVVPQKTINTIANILATCVNSNPTDPASTCSTLFSDVGGVGDTASAALALAHKPGVHTSDLYTMSTAFQPFSNALTAAPHDFTLAVTFPGVTDASGGLAINSSGSAWAVSNGSTVSTASVATGSQSFGLGSILTTGLCATFDTQGHLWICDSANRLFDVGALTSYSMTGLDSPHAIAVDASGNLWVANTSSGGIGNVSKYSRTGTLLQGPLTSGLINGPSDLAIDNSGNVWVSNINGAISAFNSAGTAFSASSYVGGSNTFPVFIAVDGAGHVWTVGLFGAIVDEFFSAANPTYDTKPYQPDSTLGGAVVVDGLGRAFVSNGSSISAYTSSGTLLSTNAWVTSVDANRRLAIDNAGTLWVGYASGGGLSAVIGIAAPVATPIVTQVAGGMIGSRP